ncbi:putative purine permease 11 [Panicum miliaceum]|uniref:Purine permease 11 n=1 Tax=Panicum miliaceum TaxID=4540 RepID=A0A3L6PS94_PANMI|nr:putative purine permease 11 [Panicum miliaceum]
MSTSGVPELESGDKGGDSRHGPGPEPPTGRLARGRGVRWWALVAVDMLVLLAGGTVATLLSRLYYNSGGNSKWMATLTQSGGAPLLAIPLLLTPPTPSEEERRRPAPSKLAAVYLGIGVLIGIDNLMYAYALQYLPVSTFSLVAATQLAFNAVTSRLINAQHQLFSKNIESMFLMNFYGFCKIRCSINSSRRILNFSFIYPLGIQ